MDPPLQDELRQAIVELTARLGHLEARYDEENAHTGRNNNRHGPGKTIETMKTTQLSISK